MEQTIGRWKRRFHSLHGELRIALERVPQFVISSAVLHNICCLRGQVDVDDEEEDQFEDNQPPHEHFDDERMNTGTNTRNSIVERYFSR